ncbi:MAG: DUF2786 domain-containing protein [Sulfuritalea sp.]|nr:DUF2786 domain-containing protein [Sulfuritalea sp.]
MDKEQAIRKAQKLMAVAMDGRGNGHEAERALAQAEALMRKFGIEQAEIASTKAATDFDWAEAFHAYGPPKNPARSCPRWFQFISTGVANFTDTIVRLHYDPAQGFGVGFYGERADTLFAQWLVGYLKASVWEALNAAHRQHPEWNRSDMEDFRKAMAARLSPGCATCAASATPNSPPQSIAKVPAWRWCWSPTNWQSAMRNSAPRNTSTRASPCAIRWQRTRVAWRVIRSGLRNPS